MNSITPKHTTDLLTSLSLFHVLSNTLVSGFTLIVALLFTVISICLRLSFNLVRTVVRLALRWSVYLLLGTLFLCTAFFIIVLSVITLGAVSLP